MSALDSPFGLLADLGAAVAAELGLGPREIAEALSKQSGGLVSDQAARAAAVRGRRELVARRLRPELYRPIRAVDVEPPAHVPAAGPPSLTPAEPGVRYVDVTQQLLEWGEHGPQRAGTLAARIRAQLAELAAMRLAKQAAAERAAAKNDASMRRRRQAAHSLPPDASIQQRREYFDAVRRWAEATGMPYRPGARLPVLTIRAYEHAMAVVDQASARQVDALRAAKEIADRDATAQNADAA